MLPSRWLGGWLGSAVLMVASISPLRGAEAPPGTIQENFESARPAWHQEQTDATIRLIAHERSNRAAHEGRFSERFQFESGPGSAFYYSYSLPKVPVTDALQASLYVRSNRAGVQVFGRVVLPGDTDPDTGQPSFVLVPGPIYENSERWQKLELIDLRPSVERQARVLRASTKRPVGLDGAYLDRLVVNLYGGPGESEVFLDELTVAPVPAELIAAHNAPPLPAPTAPQQGRRPPHPSTAALRRSSSTATGLKRDRLRLVLHGHPRPGGRRGQTPPGGVRRPGRGHRRRPEADPGRDREGVPVDAHPQRQGRGPTSRPTRANWSRPRRRTPSATRSRSGTWATIWAGAATRRPARRSWSGSARPSAGSAASQVGSRG